MNSAFDWGHEIPKLSGPRVDLRWLTPEDADDIFAIFSDPAVMKYWSSTAQENIAAAVAMIENIQQAFAIRQLFQWGICERETSTVIGTCTLFKLDMSHRRAEIGIALGRAAWGRGLASEALAILMNFSFDTLNLHRLEADVDPDNERSLRLFEHQGFKREGYLRERWHLAGEIRDTLLLGLLAREWPNQPDRQNSRASLSSRT